MPLCNRFIATALAGALLAGCAATGPGPSKDPGPADARLPRAYQQALDLMGRGDYEAAIPALQDFAGKQPDLAGPWINLGIAWRKTGQADKALAALQKAVQLNPDSAAAHHQLAIEYREQGQFEASLQAYQQSLQKDAGYALAHRNVGILYDLYLQQPAAALEHYRRYLELTAEPDQDVERWVVDLERRTAGTQASVSR